MKKAFSYLVAFGFLLSGNLLFAQTSVTNVTPATPSLVSPAAPVCGEQITTVSTSSYYTDGRPSYQQCQSDCISGCESSAGTNSYYCSPTAFSSPCYMGCVPFTPVVYKYEWQYHISGQQNTFPNPNYAQCQSDCISGCESSAGTNSYYCSPTAFTSSCYTGCQPYLKPPEDIWLDLGNVDNNNAFSFSPADGAIHLTSDASIQFRVRVTTSNGQTSNWSSASPYYAFVAPAPKIISWSTDPSCPLQQTGVVHVTVDGIGNYKYIVRSGYDNTSNCTPNSSAQPCFSGVASGSASGYSFVLNTTVKGGQYTLWIANNGGTSGSCSSKQNILVDSIPALSIQLLSKTDVACYNQSNGEIKLSSSGGKAPFTYSLSGTLNDGSNYNPSNTTGIFSSIKAANYKGSVIDACSQVSSQTSLNVTVAEPKQILATPDSIAVTCNSPANGKIMTTASGGSGTYNYYLTLGGSTVSSLLNTTATSWFADNLGSGSYTLQIKDVAYPSCDGYIKSLQLNAPPTLSISAANFYTDSVTCYNGKDGKLTLQGLDFGGSYQYILTSSATGASVTNTTTSTFVGLNAGQYTLTMKRNLQCNDAYTYSPSIQILQPTEITAVLSKNDISCYGQTDGNISTSVSGGTGSVYTYDWEYQINGSWSSLSKTTPDIFNLGEGYYHVVLRDKKNCTVTSDSVLIVEPAQLLITNVNVQDIVCFNGKGSIALTASGGITPYTYEYSNDGSQTFNAFTSATPLDAGTYVVMVKDKNNCTYQQSGNFVITAPPSALAFTEQLSDFNGVNISCYGGSNGWALLTATGGNGANYTGYMYALDAGTYQTDPTLPNINAGSHTLNLKDGRGCVVSKSIVFTQTTAKLTPVLVQKKDVTCYGDTNGLIEVSGSGGLSPYQYSINGSAPSQDNGLFDGLGIGDYTITIFDKNNCDNNFNQTITSINPAMVITSSVKDVSCFGGHDGSVTLTVSGGVSPFQYKWKNLTTTAAAATGLITGTYDTDVTDNAGCKMSASNFVNQPASSLRMGLLVIPVCYDKTDGRITIALAGGTPPYFYSIDDGSTYQSDPLFPAVGLGTYKVKGKDINDCSVTAQAQVIQRNDKPEPNFLVATKRNALDTLVITEISVPKPDSIIWTFDASVTVISNDSWDPQIKFSQPGTYTVTMTGFFGGCDYAVTKEIFVSPFDPNAPPDKNPSVKPITSFTVTPNPSSGEFDVDVTLNKKRNLSIVVYDMIGAKHYEDHWESTQEVKQRIVLDNISSGVYLVRAITETDAQDVRMVINK